MMDCARCEDLLFARLGGASSDAEGDALDAHLHACARCRELRDLLREPAHGEPARPEVSDDFLESVLERTSKPVARALSRLRTELPELAELDPGEGFVDDVMALTVHARGHRRLHVPRAFVARVRRLWQRLAQRPRLALEGAYAATLVAFLVFGLPSTSVAELPVRAVDGVRREAVRVERAVSTRFDALVDSGIATWADSTNRAARVLGRDAVETGSARLEEDLHARTHDARAIAASIWQRLFAPFFDNLRAAWRALRASDPPIDRNG